MSPGLGVTGGTWQRTSRRTSAKNYTALCNRLQVSVGPLTRAPGRGTIRRIHRTFAATAVLLASVVATLLAQVALVRQPDQPALQPAAPVTLLMSHLIEPRAGTLFAAVGVTSDHRGTVEHAPDTEEEWLALRRDAVMLAEAANLLLVPRRRIVAAHDERRHLDKMVWRDPETWNRHVLWLAEATGWALEAIDRRSAVRLESHAGDISLACELCHLNYRYPGAARRLDLPDR